MPVFVKAHNRGGSAVRAYARRDSIIARQHRLGRVNNRVAKSLERAIKSGNVKLQSQRWATLNRLGPKFTGLSMQRLGKSIAGKKLLGRFD